MCTIVRGRDSRRRAEDEEGVSSKTAGGAHAADWKLELNLAVSQLFSARFSPISPKFSLYCLLIFSSAAGIYRAVYLDTIYAQNHPRTFNYSPRVKLSFLYISWLQTHVAREILKASGRDELGGVRRMYIYTTVKTNSPRDVSIPRSTYRNFLRKRENSRVNISYFLSLSLRL